MRPRRISRNSTFCWRMTASSSCISVNTMVTRSKGCISRSSQPRKPRAGKQSRPDTIHQLQRRIRRQGCDTLPIRISSISSQADVDNRLTLGERRSPAGPVSPQRRGLPAAVPIRPAPTSPQGFPHRRCRAPARRDRRRRPDPTGWPGRVTQLGKEARAAGERYATAAEGDWRRHAVPLDHARSGFSSPMRSSRRRVLACVEGDGTTGTRTRSTSCSSSSMRDMRSRPARRSPGVPGRKAAGHAPGASRGLRSLRPSPGGPPAEPSRVLLPVHLGQTGPLAGDCRRGGQVGGDGGLATTALAAQHQDRQHRSAALPARRRSGARGRGPW